ncbi:MAG: patatin-like phospholipase family protein [Bacteroidetes bacterium]|nr:patatin-like phospholipase family protein [Bacteroidota bacterium]
MRNLLFLPGFFLLLLPGLPVAAQYKNLVFEGGGIRGISYAGAIKALEENGRMTAIERTAGSSVGALAALMVSLGYNATEIDSLMRSLKLQSFNDGQYFFIGGQSRLRRRFGWYKGDRFEHWVEHLVATKTGDPYTSFAGLSKLRIGNSSFKDFYCTGTYLSRQQPAVFGIETTPQMRLSTAVRISMSVPLYFEAVLMDDDYHRLHSIKQSPDCHVWVDGGLLLNYPIGIFDSCTHVPKHVCCRDAIPNIYTLGLKLERPEQISNYAKDSMLAPYKITNLKEYISSFYNIAFETLNGAGNLQAERGRTVYISTAHMSPRVRKVSAQQKELLYRNGYEAVLATINGK